MEWQLTSPGKEYNRQEGTIVYYHIATGNTHLISELAGRILGELAIEKRSIQYLEDRYGDEATDNILHELREIHLVEPV